MRLHRATSLVIAGVLLAGCMGDNASPSVSSTIAPTAPTASSPPAASASASAEPIPSDDLGAFSCDLPVVEDATVALANITDVRVGTHADHDRVEDIGPVAHAPCSPRAAERTELRSISATGNSRVTGAVSGERSRSRSKCNVASIICSTGCLMVVKR